MALIAAASPIPRTGPQQQELHLSEGCKMAPSNFRHKGYKVFLIGNFVRSMTMSKLTRTSWVPNCRGCRLCSDISGLDASCEKVHSNIPAGMQGVQIVFGYLRAWRIMWEGPQKYPSRPAGGADCVRISPGLTHHVRRSTQMSQQACRRETLSPMSFLIGFNWSFLVRKAYASWNRDGSY
jgi:hypothetical protein